MPTYEFFCGDCKKKANLVMKIAEYEKTKKFKCPKCGGTNMKRQISSFQTVTSRKS